ncbi:GUN4 domain-containing protein [Microcoleus anatoxicus]|uniref:GUN4 domain-containing protein n=1 Tax=Microcoleus anatoxicus TaxID=2705319 RepID=UPI0030C92636
MDLDYGGYVNQGQAQLMTWLKEKLAANEWKKANELTKVLMLKISSRKDGDYLYLDIDNCPDKEIKEIDQLWLDHTGDYFGFSAQKDIYNRGNYQQFITNVGWYEGDSWLNYDDLFYWKTALKGHLPYCGWYFWQRVYAPSTSSHLSNHKHSHQPHYHAPHRHDSGGGAAGAAAMGAAALAAAPWVIGAAAVGGAGYLIYREVTKDERKRKERLEREEAERKERQKRLEEENKVEKNIGALLALV